LTRAFRRHRFARALLLALVAGALTLPAMAQESVVHFDPAQTKITFTLDDILHTVRGAFTLKSGEVRFDRQTGAASGALVIDAASGDSGNHTRDKKMHKDILQTDRYPEITFVAQRVMGTVPASGAAQIQVAGIFRIHGADHPLTLTLPVETAGSRVKTTTSFEVPYVAWGMKDPSTFILRVGKTVKIDIAAVGQIASPK